MVLRVYDVVWFCLFAFVLACGFVDVCLSVLANACVKVWCVMLVYARTHRSCVRTNSQVLCTHELTDLVYARTHMSCVSTNSLVTFCWR